jgi:hypothetical protein
MVWAVQRYVYMALVLTTTLTFILFFQPHALPVRTLHSSIPQKYVQDKNKPHVRPF